MTKDFKYLVNNKYVINLYDLKIQEQVKKNTSIITIKDFKDDKVLKNYIDYHNYKSSFIDKNKNFCFFVFCKFFRLYNDKNFNLEYNKIQGNLAFLKNINNKRLKDIDFNGNNIKVLYKLFLDIKNDR